MSSPIRSFEDLFEVLSQTTAEVFGLDQFHWDCLGSDDHFAFNIDQINVFLVTKEVFTPWYSRRPRTRLNYEPLFQLHKVYEGRVESSSDDPRIQGFVQVVSAAQQFQHEQRLALMVKESKIAQAEYQRELIKRREIDLKIFGTSKITEEMIKTLGGQTP